MTSSSIRPCVLAAGFLPDDAMAMLQQRYTVHDYYNADDKPALLARVAPEVRCVVGTSHAAMPATLLNALPNLAQISIYGMGVENIDLEPLRTRHIPLTNTPDVMVDDVADLGMTLILTTARRVIAADRFVRAGHCATQAMPFSHSVRGMTLGIAGLGRIGREIARRAEVFGMQVKYYNRSKRRDVPYDYVPGLRALAEQADVLLLSTPGGEATRHMVNADILTALGPRGTLINIGRGSLVDENALIKALRTGTIAAAGLDVFADLAHPPAALFELDNVVLSPHRGSATFEARSAMARLFVANVDACFNDQPLLTPVIPDARD